MHPLVLAAGWLACFVVGVGLQRRSRDPKRLSHILFLVLFWGTSPLVVFFSYTTVELEATLAAAMAVVVCASWLVLGIGLLWGRLAGRSRSERGSLAIATAMGNTSFVGYSLATIVFGPAGLALAVIYSEFQFLVPSLAVSTGVARHDAGPQAHVPAATGVAGLVRSWAVNPPVAAGVLALALRFAGVDLTGVVEPVGPPVGVAIGMFGFAQVGLAMPLGRLVHTGSDLWRAAVTLALRCLAAPLILFALGAVSGVEVPGVFLLLAATPVAFHTLVLARVYDLSAELLRLLIIVSTPLVVVAVLVGQAL